MMNIDEIMNNLLTLDDTFAFHCKGCGKCCKHREDILLTPRDAFRAAGHLDMQPSTFIQTYGEVYIGDTSRLPVVRLRPVGKTNDCPMLDGKRCRIHASKPVLCALFPLGRLEQHAVPASGADPASGKELEEPVTLYFKTDTDCPTNRNITVRKWLARFGIEENDIFQKRYSALCIRLATLVRKMAETEAGQDNLRALYDLILITLYFKYEMDKPFEAQFEANADTLALLLDRLENAL